MKFIAAAATLLLFGAVDVRAQTPKVERIEIVEKGIYRSEFAKRQVAPSSPTGDVIAEVSSIELVSKTTTIPAKLQTQFGFDFRVIGTPKGAKVGLMGIFRYPKEGLRNPKTGKTTFRTEYPVDANIGEITVDGYAFEEEWELVPGQWTLELWYQGRKLAEQAFTVVKP